MTGKLLAYPPRLKLARLPTPLTPLERFSEFLPPDVRIWVKRDELTGTEVSGNKIRKLEFTLAQAQLDECTTLITCGGIQSNHCRATAVLGARLGFKVHLILRGEKPAVIDGNLLMDYLSGAQITYLQAADWAQHQDLAAEMQQTLSRQGQRAFFIPVGASDEIGLWGYVAASEELQQDFVHHDLQIDAIAFATGSGGTQAGLIAGKELFNLDAQIMAFNVCDDAEYFRQKTASDLARWQLRYEHLLPSNIDWPDLPVHTIEGYVGPGYGRAHAEVFETIKRLARTEGLFVDPVYTGKAFHGMLQEIDGGRLAGARNIVFIHTGGLYGLFPQKDQFAFQPAE